MDSSGGEVLKHCPNAECESLAVHGLVAEYLDSVTVCKHCSSPLVKGPAAGPEARRSDWRDLVQVASFLEVHQAYAAQSALRAAGIHAVVPDQYYSGLRWDHAIALGGVRVCVPAEEAAAAQEILSGIEPREVERAALSSRPASRFCPSCGSAEIVEVVRGRVPAIASLLLLGVPLLFVRKRVECRSCGSRYTP